jgi:transposase
LEVNVAHAQPTKTLPGRKTDVPECQWLQKLHTVGLLNKAFRPAEEIRVRRSYLRQRENLVAAAAMCGQPMQKALTEMNLQLANVISDISGTTGMAILRDIVRGERDPEKLARPKHARIRASHQEIARRREGTWREELLFVVGQSLELYDTYQEKIQLCDQRIDEHLHRMEAKVDPASDPIPKPTRRGKGSRRRPPHFDLRGHLYRITGVDLTQIDSIDVRIAQTVISEVGLDMSRWKTEKHFASWLGLCPDNRTSGGKVLKRGTRRSESGGHRFATGCLEPDPEPERTGRKVSSSAIQTWGAQSHHRHGAHPGSTCLSDAQVRSPLRGSEHRVLRS